MHSSHRSGPIPEISADREALQGAEERERAGDWIGAARIYSALFAEARTVGDAAAMAESLRKGARATHRAGNEDEAAELAQLSLEIAVRNGLGSLAARAENLLALFAHSAGRLQEAEALYNTALERAREADDGELIGAVCQNLGVLANIRGDLREARALYFECVGSVVRSGDRAAAMAAYNNLGMVCGDLREWLEAEIYFGRGIEIATQVGDSPMLAKLLVNRAEPLIEFGELDQACEALRNAEELAEHLEDDCLRVDILRFRARIHRIREEYEDASRTLDHALRLARDAELRLEEAEVQEEASYLRWAEGRAGPAKMLLREAARIYDTIGARDDCDRLERVSVEWSPDADTAAMAANS
jgi:tetratricopeptide (TPR) repeat protein